MPTQENLPNVGCANGCGTPCPTAADGLATATCDSFGNCAIACAANEQNIDGQCVCAATTSCESAAWECGDLDDGCGNLLDCGTCDNGADCGEGHCGCAPDDAEPNGSNAPHGLGTFVDSPTTTRTFEDFSLASASDEDWFRATVTDEFSVFTNPGNPDISVTLTAIPGDADYDLAAWYECKGGSGAGGAAVCETGTPENGGGHGCFSTKAGNTGETVKLSTSCNGSDESGTLRIRVRAGVGGASRACEPYTLTVKVN